MERSRIVRIILSAMLLAACGGSGIPDVTPTPSPSSRARPVVAELVHPRAVVHPAGGESFVNPGVVVQLGGRLHILTNSFTGYPGPSFVTHLVSTDGIRWQRVGTGDVLGSSDVRWADEGFTTSFLTSASRSDDGSWVAYGYTYDGEGSPGSIWRGTAPAIHGPWRIDPRPVLEPGPEGAWDGVRIGEPSVVRSDDGWRLYYSGYDDEDHARIGVATSTDGVTWTKRDDPIFQGGQAWDGGSVENPQVVPTADGYVMVYRTQLGFGFGIARSDDGLTWEPSEANPIMDEDRSPGGKPFFQSEAVEIDGQLRWWLEVGFASAKTHLFDFRLDPGQAW